MLPSIDWLNKSDNKVKQILDEVNETIPLKLPIPIFQVVRQYIPDVKIYKCLDLDINMAISACASKDMVKGWYIAINGYEPRRRQRFSLAHELAHIVLMPNPASTVFCGKGNDWEEKLCNRFAGKILVPDRMLIKYNQLKPMPYLEDIVEAFQVSPEVAHIRLKDLALPFKVRFEYPFIR